MNAMYMKSDVRARCYKTMVNADMSKVKDAPKMQTAMKKTLMLMHMVKIRNHLKTKPGSIEEAVKVATFY